jgi:hypothetical protein
VINLTGWIYIAAFVMAAALFYLSLLWLILYLDDHPRRRKD